MDNYFTRNQTELLATAVTIALFIILKLIITKVVKTAGTCDFENKYNPI